MLIAQVHVLYNISTQTTSMKNWAGIWCIIKTPNLEQDGEICHHA